MSFAEAWSLAFPDLMWVLLAVSAVLCAIGFYKFVYFLSIGYGFAVAGEAIAMVFLFSGKLDSAAFCALMLFIIYGMRLSFFLLLREIKSASYRKTLTQATKADEKPMPFFVKAVIWICVSVLYVAQVSPVYYRLANDVPGGKALPLLGAAIMLFGVIFESLADIQKSSQKKERPDMVATKGLYRLVRCPNYLGEIMFWTGVLLSGCTALRGAVQWIIAIFGYICIVYIMFNGSQRLEKRQQKRYGSNPEYREYADHTPILLPFIPLYHLIRAKEKGNE